MAAKKIGIRFGEAMVEGSSEPYWTEPEIAIGELSGPVGQAMANLMGQSAGFSRFFALVDGDKMVKPATLMVPKVQLKKMLDVDVFGGPVQAGIADGVLDAVDAGLIKHKRCESIGIICMVWVHPDLCKDPKNIDYNEVYENNRKAMKLAIEKALTGKPDIDELLAEDRSKPRHFTYDAKSKSWSM
ncbi:MAG: 5,6,7,8-tetrahydromethanopterin hydro-lyase [Gammaproteobacteria bacterium]|jgi:5,6,7,8-tetrahydromethanopterin hydro-lyase